MKSFEFKTVKLFHQEWQPYSGGCVVVGPPLLDQLNDLGRQGWMIAHVLQWDGISATCLLQRECPGTAYRD